MFSHTNVHVRVFCLYVYAHASIPEPKPKTHILTYTYACTCSCELVPVFAWTLNSQLQIKLMFSRTRMHLRVFVYIYIHFCVYVCSFVSRCTSGNFVSHFSAGKKSQKSALLPFIMAKLGERWLLRILTRWVWFGWFSSRLGPSPQSLNESHIWMNEPHKRMTASHICDTDMIDSCDKSIQLNRSAKNPILLPSHVTPTNQQHTPHGVATISMLLKIIGLFCRICLCIGLFCKRDLQFYGAHQS